MPSIPMCISHSPYPQIKRMMESDAVMTEDLIAYNIIPLDAPMTSNAIVSFSEVRYDLFILQICKPVTRELLLGITGASCSISHKVFQGITQIAREFSYTSYKECRYIRLSAFCFWFSGLHLKTIFSLLWVLFCLVPNIFKLVDAFFTFCYRKRSWRRFNPC